MKLADYLALKNQSDAAFAAEIGVTSKAVQHWVSGARTPNSATMQKIIEATKGAVKPNDFFSESEGAPFRPEGLGDEAEASAQEVRAAE